MADETPEGDEGEQLVWERRLSRRAKLWHALMTGGVVLAALAVILSGTGLAPSLWSWLIGARPLALLFQPEYPTIALRAPATVAGSPWEAIAVPAGPNTIWGYEMAPDDPNTILACYTPVADSSGTIASDGPFTLWRTQDAGAHWTQMPLPAIAGVGCGISAVSGTPGTVLAQVSRQSSDLRHGCTLEGIFLSHDDGLSWEALPSPPRPVADTSGDECHLSMVGHHLYFMYTYYDQPTKQNEVYGKQEWLIERSDDAGRTWARIDSALPHTLPAPLFQAQGSQCFAAFPQPGPFLLYASNDTGNTWRQVGPLPEDMAALRLPRSGDPPATFFGSSGGGLPIGLYRTRLFQSRDLRTWTALPPLPIPGTSITRPGITYAAGVTASGKLVALSGDPSVGIPPAEQSTPAPQAYGPQWLWIWDPQRAHWTKSPTPTPPHTGCDQAVECMPLVRLTAGPSPDGRDQGTYAWALFGQPNNQPFIYRMYLPGV